MKKQEDVDTDLAIAEFFRDHLEKVLPVISSNTKIPLSVIRERFAALRSKGAIQIKTNVCRRIFVYFDLDHSKLHSKRNRRYTDAESFMFFLREDFLNDPKVASEVPGISVEDAFCILGADYDAAAIISFRKKTVVEKFLELHLKRLPGVKNVLYADIHHSPQDYV